MSKRTSGILLHVTSLPSRFGVGDLGPEAYRFVDFLREAGQAVWQILPLVPTALEHGNSPYHSTSAFAGNPLLISPELLLEEGLIDAPDLQEAPDFPEDHVEYGAVSPFKEKLLQKAFGRVSGHPLSEGFLGFCHNAPTWLKEFAHFTALRNRFGRTSWDQWPRPLRDRDPPVLAESRRALEREILEVQFSQYLFDRQWKALKQYAQEQGVAILGDLPIYVDYDSADLWAHPEVFNLDGEKRPITVAGVPPDYFSSTGQRWGNPIYRWEVLQARGYDWWMERLERALELYDLVRLDHFRGLVAYWEIPAGEETAVCGRWVSAPADDFLQTMLGRFPKERFIAEDLGTITHDVEEIMERFGLPGMKILLFAFGPDMGTHPYIPHNLVRHCALYTGTHDNNTVRGWFETEATQEERERVWRYIGRRVRPTEVPWEMVRLCMMSVAQRVIFPLQDILGLGAEARMNKPATTRGNWQWRMLPQQLNRDLALRLREMVETYGRLQPPAT